MSCLCSGHTPCSSCPMQLNRGPSQPDILLSQFVYLLFYQTELGDTNFTFSRALPSLREDLVPRWSLLSCQLSWANYCTVLPNDGLKETMDFWVSWIIFSRLSTLVAPSYCHLWACPLFQCTAKAWGIMKPVTWDSTQGIKDNWL